MRALSVVRELLHNQRGATAVEYGLILALIVLGMLAALQTFATANTGMWTRVSNAFSAIVGS